MFNNNRTNTNETLIGMEDLVDNPTPRVPVSLCLDCSGSMGGSPIKELNKGVAEFYQAIYNDEIARYSAEISIVTFGPAQLETSFMTMNQNNRAPRLIANGGTPLGEAVKIALDSLDVRKAEYQANGVDYYQPWLVIMTDGQPNGNKQLLDQQVKRVCDLVEQRKLTIFPIGIGKHADMSTLKRFSPQRTPLRLKGLNFAQFFMWLSQSVSRVSQSTPGDSVALDLNGIKGWGAL